MPDQVLPTWGQSLGQGLSGGFENFMNQRALARKMRIEDATLAAQYEQLNAEKGKGVRADMEATAEFGISPQEYEANYARGKNIAGTIQGMPDPAASREMLPEEQAKALNLFEAFQAKAGTKKEGEKKGQLGKVEEGLRGEVQKLSKDFYQVRDAFSKVRGAAKNPSAAGDLSLIFGYMKMLDPGSTVREGEFANAENSGSVPERVRAQYNKAMRGERLADNMRRDFLERSEDIYKSQERIQKKIEEQYRALAERQGVSPENVILDMSVPFEEQARMPKQPAKQDRSAMIKQWSDQGLSREQIKEKLRGQ